MVEDRLVDSMISNAAQEHLLVECAFEAILKSLLREPDQQQIKTAEVDLCEQEVAASNEEATAEAKTKHA